MRKLFSLFLIIMFVTWGLEMLVTVIVNISDKYGTPLPGIVIGGCTVLFGAVMFWISMRDN